jgi:DNA mismatch endonuclease, patch repair protein
MADVQTKEQRSFNMSRIKGKNTKPEMLLRTFLHANGYRYNLHDKPCLVNSRQIILSFYRSL